MRRILGFRIVRWEFKVLYIAVAWIVGFVVVDLIRLTGAPAIVITPVNLLTTFVPFALAVRIFRGADEPVEPPRQWWRMTAWPTLSHRLGMLFAVLATIGVLGIVLVITGVPAFEARVDSLATTVEGTVTFAAFACLYLNSATRMKRLGIARPAQLPRSVRLK